MSKICVVDYKVGGNIFSVCNSLEALGVEPCPSSDWRDIEKADKIIFPGVGSFSTAMSQLRKLELIEVLIDKANSDVPFLGICVGMQVLFEYGTESNPNDSSETIKGLGLFAGTVKKFVYNNASKFKIPHMGWNEVCFANSFNQHPKNPLIRSIEDRSKFYFVHSYRVGLEDNLIEHNRKKFPNLEISITNYGSGTEGDFVSNIWNGRNLFACQFHVEKSGKPGLQLLENFVKSGFNRSSQ